MPRWNGITFLPYVTVYYEGVRGAILTNIRVKFSADFRLEFIGLSRVFFMVFGVGGATKAFVFDLDFHISSS